MNVTAQRTFISTKIGKIAVHIKPGLSGKTPLIFLHGVYFDHHLWDSQVSQLTDRMIIMVDMPLHGESREMSKTAWSLQDCADMLMEILDALRIDKVIAVGHSWGSMTILRAAHQHPGRFISIGLCNMPFQAATEKQKRMFRLQHQMLLFRDFYTKQTAKALFGRRSLKENPSLADQLKRPMSMLSNSEIKQTDRIVILNADNATDLITSLQVKALALKGEEDYVPAPPAIKTVVVEGGHVSPLENPEKVSDLINTLLNAGQPEF